MLEPKTDCFAYEKGEKYEICTALKTLCCKNEKCKFYKNREEYKRNIIERKDMQYI